MFRSWKMGSAFGIDIFVHSTFVLLPAWVFLSTWKEASALQALFLVVLTVAIFGCVILHELGHALAARGFGISTQDITLYPIGGVARLERMSEEPWQEFWIALAGPAVNVVIALLLGMILAISWGILSPELLDFAARSTPGTFMLLLLAANLLIAVFNLLPAFPMDGGRVLRSLLSIRMGQVRATEIAATIGAVMSMMFLVAAIYYTYATWVLLSSMVFLLGQQELALVRQREAMRTTLPWEGQPCDDEVIDVNATSAFADSEGLASSSGVHPDFSGFTWDSRSRLWVEWRNGRPVHTISVD